MSDLIDRGDLLDALDELEEEWEDAGLNPSYYDAKRAIKNAKAVQAQKKVCEWKSTGISSELQPSCRKSFYHVQGIAFFRKCPYCGGKLVIKGGE